MGLKGVTKRAVYVVGTNGLISYAWEAEIPKTQVDFAAILSAVTSAH